MLSDQKREDLVKMNPSIHLVCANERHIKALTIPAYIVRVIQTFIKTLGISRKQGSSV